jgi:quercetin dioxygenase-like cupin family protein
MTEVQLLKVERLMTPAEIERAPGPALVQGAGVTFEPGARTAWHTHPLGQTLIVTAGCGWIQREGEPVEEIRPSDVVWCSPGEKHCHGATPTTALTHIAIRNNSTVRSSTGWKRSTTRNIAGNLTFLRSCTRSAGQDF